ncbi:hypothetical protein FBU31_000231, partial [Coemansia sp. 'formosensis']
MDRSSPRSPRCHGRKAILTPWLIALLFLSTTADALSPYHSIDAMAVAPNDMYHDMQMSLGYMPDKPAVTGNCRRAKKDDDDTAGSESESDDESTRFSATQGPVQPPSVATIVYNPMISMPPAPTIVSILPPGFVNPLPSLPAISNWAAPHAPAQVVSPLVSPVQPVNLLLAPPAQPVNPLLAPAQPANPLLSPAQPVVNPLLSPAQVANPLLSPAQTVVNPVGQPFSPGQVANPVNPLVSPAQAVVSPVNPLMNPVNPLLSPAAQVANPLLSPAAQVANTVVSPLTNSVSPLTVNPLLTPAAQDANVIGAVSPPRPPINPYGGGGGHG